MLSDSNPEPRSVFRNPLLYSSIVLLAAALYVGWTFFARRQENRAIEQRAVANKRADDARTVEILGGSKLEIQNFYASPGAIRRGKTLQLCHGVANAKTVRLEPQDNPVWPSYARCVDVSPKKDTLYTLTAEDAAGHAVTATLTVQVR